MEPSILKKDFSNSLEGVGMSYAGWISEVILIIKVKHASCSIETMWVF